MRLPLFFCLVAACLLLGAVPAVAQAHEKILAEIEEMGDQANQGLFDELAKLGTEEGFEANVDAVGYLRVEWALNNAYRAFRLYEGKGELETEALEFLFQEARKHRRDENRRAATRALAAMAKVAGEELEKIANDHKDEEARRVAVQAILPRLGERGGVKSAELILESADIRIASRRDEVMAALKMFEGNDVEKLLIRRLRDRSTSFEWRLLLLELLAEVNSEEVTEALIGFLKVKDPTLQLRAVESLGARQAGEAETILTSLIKSKEPAIVRASIVALAQIMGADRGWQRRLFELAKDKEPAARMGAAVALTELGTDEAAELLHALLMDPDQRVRTEAIQQVGNLRREASIPILIERLRTENRRVAQDVARVLRLMTGLDHGQTSGRWQRWWNAEGEGFHLPEYEVALVAEKERRKRRSQNASISSFYGLQVVSDRVCFILDTSGSMSASAQGSGDRSRSRRGGTRLSVAQEELARTLKAFPNGHWFNLIFFASRLDNWEDELVRMDDRTRAKATKFLQDQAASGGTAIFDALELALEDERVDVIYILTDGEPTDGRITDPDRIRLEIKRMNSTRKVQINGVAVGKASRLLRWLAEDSGGEYREVL